MISIRLGGLGLFGTVGCATVQVGQCRCISFVRGPSQLGGTTGPQPAESAPDSRNCATGEVAFTVVRAPFAIRVAKATATLLDGGGTISADAAAAMMLSSGSGAVMLASGQSLPIPDPCVAMVRRAVERSVIQEALPLARFELVVQVISSVDDETDLQAITAAACAALVDSCIQLHDVFGASTIKHSPGAGNDGDDDDEEGNIQCIVSAHSGSILSLQSTGSVAPDALAAAVERCSLLAAQSTLAAFTSAVAAAQTQL